MRDQVDVCCKRCNVVILKPKHIFIFLLMKICFCCKNVFPFNLKSGTQVMEKVAIVFKKRDKKRMILFIT